MATPWDTRHNDLSAEQRIRTGLGFKVGERAYAALSNLAPGHGFWIVDTYTNERRWAISSEHLFQASKTTNPDERQRIFDAPTPWQAKETGRHVRLRMTRKAWDSGESIAALHAANDAKFRQNPAALELLLSTGGDHVYLYENSGDRRWGVDSSGHGDNRMGLVLMRLRRELRDERELAEAAKAITDDEARTARRKRAADQQRAAQAKRIARKIARAKNLS